MNFDLRLSFLYLLLTFSLFLPSEAKAPVDSQPLSWSRRGFPNKHKDFMKQHKLRSLPLSRQRGHRGPFKAGTGEGGLAGLRLRKEGASPDTGSSPAGAGLVLSPTRHSPARRWTRRRSRAPAPRERRPTRARSRLYID